ncbi:hypothetical protein ACEQ8H_009001, partial [Pleosporales sp. CAS-2024a]
MVKTTWSVCQLQFQQQPGPSPAVLAEHDPGVHDHLGPEFVLKLGESGQVRNLVAPGPRSSLAVDRDRMPELGVLARDVCRVRRPRDPGTAVIEERGVVGGKVGAGLEAPERVEVDQMPGLHLHLFEDSRAPPYLVQQVVVGADGLEAARHVSVVLVRRGRPLGDRSGRLEPGLGRLLDLRGLALGGYLLGLAGDLDRRSLWAGITPVGTADILTQRVILASRQLRVSHDLPAGRLGGTDPPLGRPCKGK